VEGIARWWLARQRYQDSLELVQHALDYLESQGQVEKVNASKGVVLYRKHQRMDQCS
jgi:Fe2+ or Zn2+ uptake regulation protein